MHRPCEACREYRGSGGRGILQEVPRSRIQTSTLWRQLLVLTLPPLVIGGVAYWKGQQENSDQPELLVENPNVGPLRLGLTQWKHQPPSPGEMATGHTVKYGARVRLVGQESGQWTLGSIHLDIGDLYLEYQHYGNWRPISSPAGWSKIRCQVLRQADTPAEEAGQVLDFSLALPWSEVPPEASMVRLRGAITGTALRFVAGTPRQERVTCLLGADVKAEDPPRPGAEVDRTSSLSSGPAEVRIMGEAAAVAISGHGHHLATAVAEFDINTGFSPPLWDRNARPYEIVPQKVQLLDDRGKDWLPWWRRNNVATAWDHGNLGWDPNLGAPVQLVTSTTQKYQIQVSTRAVPPGVGRLTLKAWLSRRDRISGEEDWPVEVEAVVRPGWVTRRPANLWLQNVKFVANGTQETNGAAGPPYVEASLLYRGSKPLVVRGEVDPDGRRWAPGQLERATIISQLPFGSREYGLFNGATLHEAGQGQDELLVSWSQRVLSHGEVKAPLFYEEEEESTPRAQIGVVMPVVKREGKNTRITVRYPLAGLTREDRGLYFRAEVGLRNQGMWPIGVALTWKK